MLALEPVIADRLRLALAPLAAAWQVFGYSTDTGQRDNFPLAGVLFADARVTDSKTGAAEVQPAWRVTLVARKAQDAAQHIDEAFAAAVAHLHNWSPGAVADRRWHPLSLEQVMPPQYPDDGLVGVELTFNTHARYDGQV